MEIEITRRNSSKLVEGQPNTLRRYLPTFLGGYCNQVYDVAVQLKDGGEAVHVEKSMIGTLAPNLVRTECPINKPSVFNGGDHGQMRGAKDKDIAAVRVIGGNGNDHVRITNADDLDIVTHDGNDSVMFGDFRARKIRVSLGGGNDTVQTFPTGNLRAQAGYLGADGGSMWINGSDGYDKVILAPGYLPGQSATLDGIPYTSKIIRDHSITGVELSFKWDTAKPYTIQLFGVEEIIIGEKTYTPDFKSSTGLRELPVCAISRER